MCIWCQLFSRAISKTSLYSHHNIVLIGAFCCFYKVGLGITVELNLAIMYSRSLSVLCVHVHVCFPQHPLSVVPEPCYFLTAFLWMDLTFFFSPPFSRRMPKLISFSKITDLRFLNLETKDLALCRMSRNMPVSSPTPFVQELKVLNLRLSGLWNSSNKPGKE